MLPEFGVLRVMAACEYIVPTFWETSVGRKELDVCSAGL